MKHYASTTSGFNAFARNVAPRKPTTVSQWADDYRMLSSKGSSMPGRWSTNRNPPLREPMDALSARSAVQTVVLKFPIQFGKALALDTPIPTPSGWTTMAAVQTGDWVLGADGQPVQVSATSEVFHDHACYRITFSDGETIVADAGHRWQVLDLYRWHEAKKEARRCQRCNSRKPLAVDEQDFLSVLTTEAMAGHRGRQARYAVKLAAPVQLPEQSLPLDPYLFGLWLGDGHSHMAAITTMDAEVVQAFAAYDPKPHTWQGAGLATSYGLRNGFERRLRELGVLGNKHIPCQYLRASHAQRLALLQGLLDSDGSVSVRGSVEFSSSRPELGMQVVELMWSLGLKPSHRWKKTSRKDSLRITFMTTRSAALFRLPRHLAKIPESLSARGGQMPLQRYVRSIELVPSVPTRCIAVANADHLFLCGRAFIPTHNTEVAINALGYLMTEDPGPVMVALPGEVSMNKWVAQKLNPMIEECQPVQEALTSVASRDASNTRTFKDFAGGQLYLEHAGSPSRLKSTTVKILLVDEVDEFAANLSSGDDPVDMLQGRTSAFPSTYKRLFISTPQIKGVSRIDALFEDSDQRHYHVPCPHCEHMQPLLWAGLHWSPDASQAWYVCGECGVMIEEHYKTAMVAKGRWVAHNLDHKSNSINRGYTINCLYYAFGLGPRWHELAGMWLAAQNDPAKLKTFVNDRLAESWEDESTRKVRHNAIADRAEPYALRTAPAGVLAITAGVDTQDNRLAVQIVGWGVGMQFWALDYIELMGDPADEAVWTALTDLLNRPIQHASGAQLAIEAYAHDMGGHRTEAVKNYVRQRRVRRPMAIHGAVANAAPVLGKGKLMDVTWRGRSDKRGVTVYQVGTVNAKHWLYGRLSTDADKEPEQRLTHFSSELEREYFTGLVSETYDPRKNRFEKRRGARNEPLDTWVYAFAAAHHPELRLHRYTKADWDRIAQRLTNNNAEFLVAAASPLLPSKPVPVKKTKPINQSPFASDEWSSRL